MWNIAVFRIPQKSPFYLTGIAPVPTKCERSKLSTNVRPDCMTWPRPSISVFDKCFSWLLWPSSEYKLDQQVADLIFFWRRRPRHINPGLTRIDHFCPISCCAVPCVCQIRTVFLSWRNYGNFQKALIISIWVSLLFFVWLVNDLFCIIDVGRYKRWIMHQPLSFCAWKMVSYGILLNTEEYHNLAKS